MKESKGASIIYVLSLFQALLINAQSVTIKEETMALDTYMFSVPDPEPILDENPKIYPYFKFEGYSHTSKKKDWKVVVLENDYIKVFVLPEIGGKVWGAIEKSTGEEFLYKNKVIKFRDIAMRGPWTSGGIEFNFGIIGHSPATATPVDYQIRKNDDGSVSCIVGNTDLPSNTQWRVEINLQKDKAFFETKTSWYNASALNESYYNWMTAAAAAKDDLEIIAPGDSYLEHNGNADPWPIDVEGRDLSMYRNNNFGGSKSYHIVGDYKDFFGGYYHDSNFGFGHWSPYEEMPGQKIWLWALSRSGGIWEDLLTDTDGQYIEFQAGRLFNQYSPSYAVNPITQANFEPNVMDRWDEIWFPYKEIGGMVDATKFGVLNVEQDRDTTYIGINALQDLNEDLKVLVNGNQVYDKKIALRPMEVFSKKLAVLKSDRIEVFVGDRKLYYTNNTGKTLIKRPFQSDTDLKISKSQALFTRGWEEMKFRVYDKAYESFSELIKIDPSYQGALVKLAELEYRKTNFEMALQFANRALQMDTYNPGANYMAGIAYRAQKDYINALESLGWAARDVKFRSVSYAQMAEIYTALGNSERADLYAHKALDFNTYNLNARMVLLLLAREEKDADKFQKRRNELLKIDPLNHFASIETNFMDSNGGLKGNLLDNFQNEFPGESVLDLALYYYGLGHIEEAIALLSNAGNFPKIKIWLAYLFKDTDVTKSDAILKQVLMDSVDFVFPYRRETIPVLEWAESRMPHWKFKYFLAQNYMAAGLSDKGQELIKSCGEIPDSDVFYRFRAKSIHTLSYGDKLRDYQRALSLNSGNWLSWNETIQFYLANEKYTEAQKLGAKAYKKFPKNYSIGLSYSKALLYDHQYAKSIKVLKNCNVLPFEHASEGRRIYERSYVYLALEYVQKKNYTEAIQLLEASKEWPEHLGVGKPYNVDSRLQDFLLAHCFKEQGKEVDSRELLNSIASYTDDNLETPSPNLLFGLLAYKKLGKDSEADKLLKIMEGPTNEANRRNKLALAFYKNDREALAKMKDENIVDEGTWNILEASLNY
ncbi:DUF5107 domain-containing protein [Flavobacteriaceae bacterium F89]|uniref:DUF5107 domain-containing protein n=1 Tax=Cerina litoralis TaxID=2874477 RepID=A0AAE3EQN4_9FLAO|nr:DUF5107 domain-containing protein [Cerina litoralis]MCG2459312.1 DUF5107 domain-containing protein [Cerina litoralis]